MASGIPAIVSDRIGSAHDLVVDGVTGLVFPFGDQSALATCMERLASDALFRHEMGEMARRRVIAEFTIENLVKVTRDAISLATTKASENVEN